MHSKMFLRPELNKLFANIFSLASRLTNVVLFFFEDKMFANYNGFCKRHIYYISDPSI